MELPPDAGPQDHPQRSWHRRVLSRAAEHRRHGDRKTEVDEPIGELGDLGGYARDFGGDEDAGSLPAAVDVVGASLAGEGLDAVIGKRHG